MVTPSTVNLGERIRQARERADISQSGLADLISIDRTALNKIESGLRKVSALELADISAALDVTMSSFIEEPVSALVSHRSSGGMDTTDSKVDHLLANLAADVEFVDSLVPQKLAISQYASALGALPYPAQSLTSAHDAEDLAARFRRLVGLSSSDPAKDLASLCERVGLMTFAIDLGVDSADAGTILLQQGGVSLINSHNKIGRRRLALAHELGHYLVADEYSVDWRIADKSDATEGLLDRFARALLLPETAVKSYWEERVSEHSIRESAVLTASEFRVDMATLAKRLRELEVINASEAGSVRAVTTTQADILDFGLNVPIDLETNTLPVLFKKGVIHLIRERKISRERALVLLRGTFQPHDLPVPPRRREDELWKFVS